jgi:serine/threonine protein kinase
VLTIGQKIAHYSIVGNLGKGGMGEVYQAKDQKLGRDVAIKVLPEEFARDTDRVARFQREAKLLASLNHPNIAAIHGLEESDGTTFLVLELVEGETLAHLVKKGPIPVEESLKLALQIAEALEAAHEKAVIHRDLKPSNIKVTPEGKVKVLDYGLAKAYAGDQSDLDLSHSPTISVAATRMGIIMGTAAYMSPEQAKGKDVDKRTDIWAFGCVLYEMLTGRAAFSGKDVTDILAAVIRAEPEWSSLPANLHWRLREVLERCLKKDARDRYHDICDVKVDLTLFHFGRAIVNGSFSFPLSRERLVSTRRHPTAPERLSRSLPYQIELSSQYPGPPMERR